MDMIEDLKNNIIKTGCSLLKAGLVIGSWGNISARLQDLNVFFITPSGIPYPELVEDDLVLVNCDGQKSKGKLRPSSETPLHAAIYKARPDVNGIIHTHSPFASVFAVNRSEIPPVLEEMAQLLGGGIKVAPYAMPGSRELAEHVVSSLGDQKAVLLANHGVIGIGRSLDEAFLVCQVVEKAAQVFLWAKLIGEPYILNEAEVNKLQQAFKNNYGQ